MNRKENLFETVFHQLITIFNKENNHWPKTEPTISNLSRTCLFMNKKGQS